MPNVPSLNRRQELYPGETMPGNENLCFGRNDACFFDKYLSLIGLRYSAVFSSSDWAELPGVQFPSPNETRDVQPPDGDVNRPPCQELYDRISISMVSWNDSG